MVMTVGDLYQSHTPSSGAVHIAVSWDVDVDSAPTGTYGATVRRGKNAGGPKKGAGESHDFPP